MAQSEQSELLAAIVVMLSYQSGDLPADLYDSYERARAVVHAYVPKAAAELVTNAGS